MWFGAKKKHVRLGSGLRMQDGLMIVGLHRWENEGLSSYLYSF